MGSRTVGLFLKSSMLKTRVIPVLLARGRELVKGKQFDSSRRVGNLLQAARIHNMRNVDELVILSVDGPLNEKIVGDICKDTFMPVAVGGSITSLDLAKRMLDSGADKIVVNTAAFNNPDFITELSAKYGSQSITVSIDSLDGKVQIRNGKWNTERDVVSWAHEVACKGAGEILINDVSRDGTMEGYNLELISRVSTAVRIPVVACGGCLDYEDMVVAIKSSGAHAVAAGALFQFTDNTPKGASRYLAKHGIPARCDT